MIRYYKPLSNLYHSGMTQKVNITTHYSTEVTFKLAKNAAAQHANDGNGSHTHVGTQKCTIPDCDTKKCPSACGPLSILGIDGHNTHNPPVGRMVRFIDDTDANGDPKKQYFVPVNKPNEITEEAKQAFGNQIKPDPKTLSYVKKHEDKYN